MVNIILLQSQGQGGQYQSLILILGMALIFYFFFIRPQQRKQKDQKKFIQEIKKGASVVTIGGIHGKISQVNENTVVLDVDKGTKLTVEKSSISLESSKQYQEKTS